MSDEHDPELTNEIIGAEQGHGNTRWIPSDFKAKAQHHENSVGSLPSQQQGS